MNIAIPVILVVIVGLLASCMLSYASKVFAIQEDQLFLDLRAELPGANCGGCGFAGCDDYAHALAEGGDVPCTKCSVGGPAVAAKLASLMGQEAGAMEKKIAWPDLGTESKKIRKAVAWAEAVACDNRHGYSTEGEAAKDGCSLRWPRWGKKGDYSCSTVLAMAFELFDFYSMRKNAFEKGYTTSVRFLKKPFVGFSSRNVVKVLKHSTKFRVNSLCSSIRRYRPRPIFTVV